MTTFSGTPAAIVSVCTEISIVVRPSIVSSSSQTIKSSGAINTGLGSTVSVKFMLDINQAVTKGSPSSTSTRV